MPNTYIQGTDLSNPLSGINFSIVSGGSILPAISGAGLGGVSIGSVALPFSNIFSVTGTHTNVLASNTVFAATFSGTNFTGLNYTVASGGSFLPQISGTGLGSASLGSIARPFSGLSVINLISDITLTSGTDIRNAVSGVNIIGTAALPMQEVVSNYYNGAVATSFKINEIPAGTINGSNTVFTLANNVYNNNIMLYKNGMYMMLSGISAPYYDFGVSGLTITFVNAPASGSAIVANYTYL